MRCTYFAQRRARRPHHPLPPILPCSLLGLVEEHSQKGLHPHQGCSRQCYVLLPSKWWRGQGQEDKGGRAAFGHKTDFCCIQQPNDSLNDGFYVLHHMLEYRRDHQNLRMSPRSDDAHILQWAKDIGDIEDHRLRAEFYNIQRELAQIIVKEVVGKTGMFYGEGQMSREDVQTWIASQRLDLKPFTKLGDYLPDLDGWNDMLE